MPMTLKKFAQKYPDTDDEVVDFLNPVRTTAQLADVSDPINTIDKRAGRMVWNSTSGFAVWSDGPLPVDTWSASDGLVDHSPA